MKNESWQMWGLVSVLMGVAVWMGIGVVVMAFRHPWMTDTQRVLHMREALLFQKVERPR